MPPKAVLWFHGLGDTASGWRGTFRQLDMPGVTFHHPDAPKQYVTCDGSTMTSWFDIQKIPIVPSEPEPPSGIDKTVADIQQMIADIESKGTPAENIIVGGFSQGGTISLLAGLSYPKKLGGVVSVSGWCAKRSDVGSWISDAGKQTPVFMSCGDGDPVVDFSITKESADKLKAVLGDGIDVQCPKRDMHQPDRKELRLVERFIKAKLDVH